MKEQAVRVVQNNQIPDVNKPPVTSAHPGTIIRWDSYHSILAMMDVDNDDDNADILCPIFAEINNTQQLVDAEISQYRAERKLNRIVAGVVQPNGKPISSNPLQWWSQRATCFPILAHTAKKILCIPATSAPVERLFSTAGNTIAND